MTYPPAFALGANGVQPGHLSNPIPYPTVAHVPDGPRGPLVWACVFCYQILSYEAELTPAPSGSHHECPTCRCTQFVRAAAYWPGLQSRRNDR